MKLREPLPPDRSYDQIKNHYLVEKSIADRLKKSNREERKSIFNSMYDELFSKVPDHPRLLRSYSEERSNAAIVDKFSVVKRYLNKSCAFAEFAPGDCRFSFEVAKHTKSVLGIDISDQRNPEDEIPKNFGLVIYDGYNLDEIESSSIDILFSDQLIEHFHPEDTRLHFELVQRILKKGGRYIFRTPHFLTGPHDISRFFSDTPKGFHLKEWTYIEIKNLLKELKYTSFNPRYKNTKIDVSLPYFYFRISEKFLNSFPKRNITKLARYFIPTLYGVAVK
jgi:SAM-dependent methyltransferase